MSPDNRTKTKIEYKPISECSLKSAISSNIEPHMTND
uniref:Uncharacterized protein n=1 Tax=Rhizophora mucronata TaxID=61149 RepID=A0A2P2MQE7_RHIMU